MNDYQYILTKEKKIERIKCWDENHNIIYENFMLWGKWFHEPENRIVKVNKVGDITISTVFLGIDHGFNFEQKEDHKPVLFETALIKKDEDIEIVERYDSYENAIKGHKKYIDHVVS